MEFEITRKAKNKARMRRIRKEKKWLPFRLLYIISFLTAIISFTIGILLPRDAYMEDFITNAIFSISFVIGILATCFVFSMTRHWIQERYNERLWIDNDSLCLLYQVPWGTGWNSRRLDDTAVMYQVDMSTVRQVSYDEKTKRIVIYGQGVGRRISSLSHWQIKREWPLTEKYKMVAYDYYQPSLVSTLEQRGLEITREKLNFKMFDNVYIGDPAKHGATPI